METQYSAEQEAFRQSLRRLLEDLGGTALARTHWQAPESYSQEARQQLNAIGINGLLAPESAGGFGGGMTDAGIAMEELGRQVHPGPYWSSCVGGTSAAGCFEQSELQTKLAAGEATATVALIDHAHSIAHWQTPQLIANNGELSGLKIEVPDASTADYFFVSAKDGVYLIAANAAGVSIEDTPSFDGSRSLGSVQFANAKATKVGELDALGPVVDRMLVALCADGIGAAQRTLELTVAYANERQQFGQAIGSFQAIQHLCADMLQTIELGRAGLHYALWALDAADAAEAHRATLICKAYMADTFPQIGADAIQIFGGAGFTWEYDIQLYYKRLLSLQMLWGDEQVWLEALSKLVIDGERPAIIPT